MDSKFWMFWSLLAWSLYLWSEWRRSRLKRMHREVLTAQQACYKEKVDECVLLRSIIAWIRLRTAEIHNHSNTWGEAEKPV